MLSAKKIFELAFLAVSFLFSVMKAANDNENQQDCND